MGLSGGGGGSASLAAINAGEQSDPAAPGIGIFAQSHNVAHNYGAWAEVNASTTEDRLYTGIVFHCFDASAPTYGQVQIGVGAAASEVVRGSVKVRGQDIKTHLLTLEIHFAYPIKVPSGSRVAVRFADDVAAFVDYRSTLFYVKPGDLEAAV